MAKPQPGKKRQKSRAIQLQLPGMLPPPPRGTIRISPMQLQIGDRMTDSTGEWEVVGRPYTTAGGKNAHVQHREVGPARVWTTVSRSRIRMRAVCATLLWPSTGPPSDALGAGPLASGF
jgi:hypothetical protein